MASARTPALKVSAMYPELLETLTKRGGRPNGVTTPDWTLYNVTLPASPENLELFLDLESDRMINSFIAQSDLD